MPERTPELDRRALRAALLRAEPWLSAEEFGPRAVDAGNCERCGTLPRLLPTCGPGLPAAVCRSCAQQLGDDGWCDGHRDEGRAARAWAGGLPPRWADTVVLWWVATGEIRLGDAPVADAEGFGAEIRALLPTRGIGVSDRRDLDALPDQPRTQRP